MAAVWNFCKTKMICEPDEPKDESEGAEAEEPKKGHGGCGHVQPQIRKEGLKLFVQYKKAKDDDEVGTADFSELISDPCLGGEVTTT